MKTLGYKPNIALQTTQETMNEVQIFSISFRYQIFSRLINKFGQYIYQNVNMIYPAVPKRVHKHHNESVIFSHQCQQHELQISTGGKTLHSQRQIYHLSWTMPPYQAEQPTILSLM